MNFVVTLKLIHDIAIFEVVFFSLLYTKFL